MAVKFYKSENQVPLEMHKVRMIQKLELLPVEERLKKIQTAGNNTSCSRIVIFIWICLPTPV